VLAIPPLRKIHESKVLAAIDSILVGSRVAADREWYFDLQVTPIDIHIPVPHYLRIWQPVGAYFFNFH
jgi:hypothetical protein